MVLLQSKGNGWRGCKWYRTLHERPKHVIYVCRRQRRAQPHIRRLGVGWHARKRGWRGGTRASDS
eukprot:58272-Prymnesium_polylepis.1